MQEYQSFYLHLEQTVTESVGIAVKNHNHSPIQSVVVSELGQVDFQLVTKY